MTEKEGWGRAPNEGLGNAAARWGEGDYYFGFRHKIGGLRIKATSRDLDGVSEGEATRIHAVPRRLV